MTPKASPASLEDARSNKSEPDIGDERSGVMFLLEERGETDDTSVTYVARVRKPERLLSRRGMHFHGDVVEALSDLVLSFVGADPTNDPRSRSR